MALCTTSPKPRDPYVASVSDFTHLYAHAPGALRVLCEFLLAHWEGAGEEEGATRHSEEQVLRHQLLQLYLSDALNACAAGRDGEVGGKRGLARASAARVSCACGERARARSDADGEERGVRLGKAERLLKDGWPPGAPWAAPLAGANTPRYRPDHALELCAKHRFKAGLLFLHRKQGATAKEQQARPPRTTRSHCAQQA